MKSIFYITAYLAALASADVQAFTDSQCMANRELITTKKGRCYDTSGKKSALGCSLQHNLRVYAETGCTGTYNTRAPQKCVNLGDTEIQSIKCLN
jgi:hypothetical protein